MKISAVLPAVVSEGFLKVGLQYAGKRQVIISNYVMIPSFVMLSCLLFAKHRIIRRNTSERTANTSTK
jgi:hypothetical protein